MDGTWTDVGAAPSLDAFEPTYQGRLFSFGSFDFLNIPKLSAGNYAYYFGIDLKKNGILDADSLYYSGVNVSISETWYKDTDGDGYSDGTSVLSVTRPYSNYYKESELLATSGDIDDNNPKVFPVGGITEITRIKISIQTSGAGWIAEANPISALSKDQRKRRLGALFPSSIPRSAKRKFATRDKLPSYFDWRNNNGNFVTPVKDQGNCGSCWAFSAVAALESQVMINTWKAEDLSEQIVLSCSGAGSCEGGYPTSTSDFLKNVGTNSESCYPYIANDGICKNACSDWRNTAFKIDSWTYVDNTVNDLKNAIYANGPVLTTMAVYTDFFSYRSGVYRYAWGKIEGYHAIAIVGWDDAEGCFIVKNSWGTGWGGSGYFRIGYSEVTNETEFGYLTIAYTTGKATCTYSINPTSNSVASSGGTGSVSVTATSDCTWTASSNASWITITSGSSGNGTGSVNYSVASNSGTSSRTGTITIAGQTFTVTQSGVSNVVIFPDKNLEAAIREAIKKTSGDILIFDLQGLTSLDGSGKGIVNLEGLQYCTNLTILYLSSNKISDINVLAGLTNLKYLSIILNQITNISALADMKSLSYLSLSDNQINDISALKGLTLLTSLDFMRNRINNISAIAGLTNLTSLGIGWNQITDISPIAGLTNLTFLTIAVNQVSNINALTGLTKLTYLYISDNQISDISAIRGLTNLSGIDLYGNKIIDIKPLVDNSGINTGDYVDLYKFSRGNPLSTTSCTIYIPQLKSRGVTVTHNCP